MKEDEDECEKLLSSRIVEYSKIISLVEPSFRVLHYCKKSKLVIEDLTT
jgi:hypothetical protein